MRSMGIRSAAVSPAWVSEKLFRVHPAHGRIRNAERLIGSIRRECLDHMIVLGERHLRRVLARYMSYDHGARTHLSLEKDSPEHRRIQAPTEGRVVAFAEVGGLHHRYERLAA